METVIAEAAAPEAPAAAPEAANAAEARQSLRDRSRGVSQPQASARSAAAAVNQPAQPRDETGRFAAAQAPAPETQAATPQADAATPEAAPKEAPPADRIELPADSPFRERGKQFFDQLSGDEIRGLLNSQTRKREVEQSRSEVQRLRIEAERHKAEAAAWREQAHQAYASPNEIATYNEMLALGREDDAKVFMAGVMSQKQAAVGAKAEEAEKGVASQFAEQQAQDRGLEFGHAAKAHFDSRYPDYWRQSPAYGQAFDAALKDYAAELERSPHVPSVTRLQAHLDLRYASDPSVQERVRQEMATQREQERERIRKEAQEELAAQEREHLNAAAARRQTNALGRLPASSMPASLPVTGAASSAAEARQRLRDRRAGRV